MSTESNEITPLTPSKFLISEDINQQTEAINIIGTTTREQLINCLSNRDKAVHTFFRRWKDE